MTPRMRCDHVLVCLQGEDISLDPAVGIFITMNPGYAGRTELPENLKALFRPCAMVVPDFELIAEIMMVAEGFLTARLLARKFITLYSLCKELLSKQDHYDWGLRAIKSVLVVAGALREVIPVDQKIRFVIDLGTFHLVSGWMITQLYCIHKCPKKCYL